MVIGAHSPENCYKTQQLPEGVIKETNERGYQILTIREAWLYRDWQTAIGDLMIENIAGTSRRFEVIGFAKFENMLLSDDEHTKRSIGRLKCVIDDLDVSLSADPRVTQLRQTYQNTAKLVIALAKTSKDFSAVAEATVQKAQAVVSSKE